jgi:8-oxo-dGTP diphosphatase
MDSSHIRAAGGIVVRYDPDPRIAVVCLRKDRHWVLPKGKLNGKETPRTAARREVLEETGHTVSVHEFVGALAYETRGKPKVVHFWRMQAHGGPVRKLMRDVRAVEWLPLDDAVERLTRVHERAFLASVGPMVLRAMAAQMRLRNSSKAERVQLPEPSPAAKSWLRRQVVRLLGTAAHHG